MFEEKTKSLLPIIREAGKIMTSADGIGSLTKEKGGDAANLVTAYDVAVQEFLIEKISVLFPDACFFAEEKKNNAEDLKRDCCFVIDPIDGTANFVHSYQRSSISVALFSGGEIIFGAVYDPYLDEMFYAIKNGGAFLNDKPIKVSDRNLAHAFVAFGTSPYYKQEVSEKSFRLCHELYLKTADVRRAGSAAIDLAYLAAGRNDIFFEFVIFPWDLAAGSILITEAGGKITDFDGEEIDYSKPTTAYAAPEKLYDEAYQIVKKYK